MDTQNPFQPPAADLQIIAESKTQLPLYSLTAVGLATLLGTPLAGAYFMAANLKALGRTREVNTVWGAAILILVVMTAASLVLPSSIPALVFTLPQILAMHAYARQLFGPQVLEHQAANGAFFSLWRVAGISLLFLLAALAVLIPLVLLFVAV